MNTPRPPRWAQRFLAWYCRPELLEDLQGDLNEYFDRHLRQYGPRRARWIYVLDVLKFLRLYTVRPPDFLHLSLHSIMLRSYLKTSGRSLVRNPLFSAINVIGLAISLSVGLLVLSMLADLFAYDDFLPNKAQVYRIVTSLQRQEGPGMELASTSLKAGKAIRENVPGLGAVTILRNGFGGDAQVGDRTLPLSGRWADGHLFQVLPYPLRQGNPATALQEPYSLVLTETTAERLFGTADALGQTVRLDTLDYTVTGVVRDLPKFSHLRFDVLASLATLENQMAAADGQDSDGDFLSWENVYMNYVYLTLPQADAVQDVEARLAQLCARENAQLPASAHLSVTLELQPLHDIVLGRTLSNPIGPTMIPLALWILSGLALVVILSACFNYTNLSIARSLRRSREVGVRKVIGALRSQVLGQFLIESVFISLLALGFAVVLFAVLRTQFLGLSSYLSDVFTLQLSFRLVAWFVVLAVVVGLVAGVLPALFFSRLPALQVMKNMSALPLFRRITLRKALIVVQYTFSLMFITTTLIGYQQYKSFVSFDLGYSTQNILNVKLQGNPTAPVKQALAALPGVGDISVSRMVTSLGSYYGSTVKYQDPQDSTNVWLNAVDEHYLPLHQHQFLAGRNFHPKAEGETESEVIVNEQVLKRFNIANQDPQQALGEVLKTDRKELTIVGVLKDFHYGTVESKIDPVLFRYSANEPGGYLNLQIVSRDLPTTRAQIEAAWKQLDPVHPLEARFYDDQIEEAYNQFSVMIKVIGFLAFLAICIASMGLFGMVVFTTETRLKEVSIRKVLGADEARLIYLLSRGFLMLLGLAAAVALPVTYLFFERVILPNFAYHPPIGWGALVLGTVAVGSIAALMIGSQTWKVARTNPADVLKSE
ncbi:FtsX-like permease family protein [Catalinimonas alkaloidigena]|uniref:FtsX-like permease family protein n=1 Tax=Catalinimonas alkaloidigena TaxID=1075417 RepID=A0A1G9R1S1_9BACT|nr:ABC transporter permease [Catalinimonas alkaloidigena]SDM17236.1 FtsX-like permease family protein [Catalinimonas alkaloidigena]